MGWLNDDGLYVKFGTEEATAGKAGEHRTNGDLREVMVEFDLADLSTSAETILDDNVWIPKNARIQEIDTVVITAADSASDTATLDIGLTQADDRTTAIDADGLVITAAQTTIDSAGETVVITDGSTDAGALVGTTLAANGLLTATAGTEVFTAGRLRVKVKYFFL